ncbi:MAG: 3-oxoacyl-ACP reductase FabG [Nitrospina sp.]|jgi:3-oxoacyl-[acyl-carrier protein] reductase|nr:3-oxoacyl-ACP reductase FabG [Nitrospina sp.]
MKALVTGGSGLIGSAICEALASEGLHVLVHANQNLDRARQVVEKIRSAGQSAETACFDVSDRKATSHHLENILESGPVQVLVNNAGIYDDATMAGMLPEQWDSVIQITLNGFFNVTHPLLLPMIRSRWGRIISISSITGVAGNRGQTNYAAAKSGLHGASKSLSKEVASRGITVNVVAPGIIQSSSTDEHFSDTDVKNIIPMKRRGTPQEIADAVVFLGSKKASYISGQILNVNGGMC